MEFFSLDVQIAIFTFASVDQNIKSFKFQFFQFFFLDFTMCNVIKMINIFKLPPTTPFQFLKTSKSPKTFNNIWAFLPYSALQRTP